MQGVAPLVYQQPTIQIIPNGMNGQVYTMVPTLQTPEKPKATETPEVLKNPNWSSSLCDCCGKDCACGDDCNCGTCCLAGCWSSLQMGFTLEHLGIVSSSIMPTLLYTIAELFTARTLLLMTSITLRRSLVTKLERKENPCESFCIMCCCFPCGIAQIERDIKARNYVFDTPTLDKSNLCSCTDVISACCGGISKDSFPHARDPKKQLGTPFTKNSMFRYYTRIPSQ
jgi:Cys-rich protein (TIGR01571 family)